MGLQHKSYIFGTWNSAEKNNTLFIFSSFYNGSPR